LTKALFMVAMSMVTLTIHLSNRLLEQMGV
jgi:hypothetical protein